MSRLDRVLHAGLRARENTAAKERDQDGNVIFRQVEFEPMVIQNIPLRDCIPVPWSMYERITTSFLDFYDPETRTWEERRHRRWKTKGTYFDFFLVNVVADSRLGEHAQSDVSNDITSTSNVQWYAYERWLSIQNPAVLDRMPMNQRPVTPSTVWVMEYVETDDFAKYCLVPRDSRGILERLELAKSHVERLLTDDKMLKARRREARWEPDEAIPTPESLDPSFVAVRTWYLQFFDKQIARLRSEGSSDSAMTCPGKSRKRAA